MAKLARQVGDDGERVTLRLDKATALYYRKRAQEHRSTLSEFLRNMVVQGMIAETALDVEQRMRAVLAEMNQETLVAGRPEIPENVLLSLYTSEFLLTAIVEARNIQELYDAQNKARARIRKERAA